MCNIAHSAICVSAICVSLMPGDSIHARNSLGSVWNPENKKERKINTKENDFLMFGFTVENIKKKKKNLI